MHQLTSAFITHLSERANGIRNVDKKRSIWKFRRDDRRISRAQEGRYLALLRVEIFNVDLGVKIG